ncbi:MAG: hypothetical protein CSA36_08865 [Draconibacterium sp.]|nr:MAG: hypothetical protein CSA36_08865 [Draconibacterium sp.]
MLLTNKLIAQAKYRWCLYNLVAFIRLNLFVKVDLQKWLDNPFQKDKPQPKQTYQGGSFLKIVIFYGQSR